MEGKVDSTLSKLMVLEVPKHSQLFDTAPVIQQLHCFRSKLGFSSISKYNKKMIPWLAQRYGSERLSYFLFGASQVLFPLSFLYVNQQRISPVQTSLLRGIALIVMNYLIARYYNMTLDFKYDVNFNNLFKRNAIVVFHGIAIATAQFYLPLPIVFTVNFFAPIFIFIIDYFQNGIELNKTQLYCLLTGVLGIVCAINSELVTKLLDSSYQIHTQFHNYINLDPVSFSFYGLALLGVMFIWAYGILRVRSYFRNTHVHVNFHLGILFIISSCFLYPLKVGSRSDIQNLLVAFLVSAVPMAFAQLMMTAALGLNKKTGQIIVLSGVSVLMGYVISFVKYGEAIEPLELIGSILILMGLVGVINCGSSSRQEQKTLLGVKVAGTESNQSIYRVIRMC